MPRKPVNAFVMYCREQRDKLRAELQENSLPDLTKVLGQQWQALSLAEKKVACARSRAARRAACL